MNKGKPMPLEKSASAAAFVRNLKTELAAGKPRVQALAIAYSVQREAKKAEMGGSTDLAQQTGTAAMQLEGGFRLPRKGQKAEEILLSIAKALPANGMVKKALDLHELARMEHEPTAGQRHAGNYQMGHTRVHGLDITIETPKGGFRSGVARDGKAWKNTLAADYGYIRGVEGADKDHLDCFVGPALENGEVHIIHQHDPETGKFDELKCCLGFASKQDAIQAYLRSYQPGWKGMGRVQTLGVQAFKEWLKGQPKTVAKAETSHFLVTSTGKTLA